MKMQSTLQNNRNSAISGPVEPGSLASDATGTCAPTRYSNPFSTCWTRPGAIAFHFTGGQSAGLLVKKFAIQKWRGAIVGPHGSGKSTLLETLKPLLQEAGWRLLSVSLRDRQTKLPPGILDEYTEGSLLIVDGYEQLSWLERLKLLLSILRGNRGLLITAHSATLLPMLVLLEPDTQLIQSLVAELTAKVSTSITSNHVQASCRRHGGNVREILFDLYDRHERSSRGA